MNNVGFDIRDHKRHIVFNEVKDRIQQLTSPLYLTQTMTIWLSNVYVIIWDI